MGFVEDYLARNRNVTTAFMDMEVTDGVRRYLAVQVWTSAFASLFGLGALAYLLLVSCRLRDRTPSQRSIVRLVVAQVALMTLGCVGIFFFTVVRVPASAWAVCSYLGTIPSFGYCAGNGISYYIFLKRAGSVRLQERSQFSKVLLYLAIMGTYSIPGLLLLLLLVVNGKIIFGDVCFQDHPWWLAWMFTVMDTLLSTVFLYIFLEPVLQQMRAMRDAKLQTASSQKMAKVAKVNLFWSSVTIFTTMVFLSSVSIVPMRNENTPETIHNLLITWTTQPLDSFVNMFAILAISSGAWHPKKELPTRSRLARSHRTFSDPAGSTRLNSVRVASSRKFSNAQTSAQTLTQETPPPTQD